MIDLDRKDKNPVQTLTSISEPLPISVSSERKVLPIAFYIGVLFVLLGTLLLCVQFGFTVGLTLVPFTFGPLMLAWIPMWRYRNKRSQGVLVIANIAFAVWFLYIYVPMRYPHNVSELDGLGMVAVGVFSLPVLFVLSIIAMVLHWQAKSASD